MSNKLLAAAMTLVVLAQAAPLVAAQTFTTDLVPVAVNIGQGVADMPTNITVTIKNQGSQTFTSARGWQVYVAYSETRNFAASSCVTGGTVSQNSPCYQRIQPTDTRNSINAGSSVTVTVPWTPSGVTHGGTGTLWVQVEELGCSQGVNDPVTCPRTGPDANPNNNLVDFQIFVKRPGVRAVPLAAAPPTDSSVNAFWKFNDVKDACPAPADPAPKACKPQAGSIVTFAYNVINQGNAVDSFKGTVVDQSSAANTLAARKIQVFFGPDPIPIPPGESREVRVQILIPESEWANNQTNINRTDIFLNWASTLNPSVSTASPRTDAEANEPCTDQLNDLNLCRNPSFPSLIIDVKRDLNVTTNETHRHARAGEQVLFNLTINNTGNFRDAFTIAVDWANAGINHSWAPIFPDEIVLPAKGTAGSVQNISIALIPPANATKGKHAFDVVLQSKGDSTGKTLRRVTLTAELEQRFAISGGVDQRLIRVVPADTARYVMRITNTGNGIDNVSVTMENVPFGWNAALSTRNVAIPAFATVPVYLNLTPPANAAENLEAEIFVNFTSQGPAELSSEQRPKTNLSAKLTVLRGPNLEVRPQNCGASACTGFIDPGTTRTYDLVVRNTGNVRDNFSVRIAPPSDLAWTVTAAPDFAVLDPLQEATIRVTMRAPTSGTVGETAKSFVYVTSTVDASRDKQTTVEGRVSGPDLFVAGITTNATNPYMGDPLELSVVLGNNGNKAPPTNATLKLYWVAQGGSPQPITERKFLPAELPGGRRISEPIVWDTTGIEGAGTIVARIDEDNIVAEIDESPASNEAARSLTLRVFDISLVPAQPLAGRPGEKVHYNAAPHEFVVTYRGNQPSEPVDIFVTSENGWGESRLSISLPQGTPISVHAELRVPTEPGVAKDTLRVTVVPTLRPTSAVTAAVSTIVLDSERPNIRGVIATPDTVKLGDEVTIHADVTDATGLSSVRAFVVTPDNETVSVLLVRQDDGGYANTQRWTSAGLHRLFVEAIDGSDNANKNTTRETPVMFTVTAGSAPKIELAKGQKTTIRTGAPLKLEITDPLGVARATYSIRGVSYDLPRPFSIDTSSFQPGTIDVTVTAENIYGVKTTTVLSFSVDNTPPAISAVLLTPNKPKANEDVVLRIETDGQVEGVEVLIKRDGQVVETRAAEKKGSTVFELLLNPALGDYTIDVTATDAAGNAKLQQGAVQFSAKAAGIPAPGLLAALAALGVVAMLLRRRE